MLNSRYPFCVLPVWGMNGTRKGGAMEAGMVPAMFFLAAVAYAVVSAVQNYVRELRAHRT